MALNRSPEYTGQSQTFNFEIRVTFCFIVLLLLEKKVFTIYGHCGHVGHVTQLFCINSHSHSHLSFHMSFGSKSPKCFYEKEVLTLKSE